MRHYLRGCILKEESQQVNDRSAAFLTACGGGARLPGCRVVPERQLQAGVGLALIIDEDQCVT